MAMAFRSLRILIFLFSGVHALNLCNLEPSICVPLTDLKPNCTCILQPPGPSQLNLTAESSVFIQQHSLPADLFSFVSVPENVSKLLGERLPPSEQYSSHLMTELPSSEIREQFFILALNQSTIQSFFLKIDQLKILADSHLSSNLPFWCSTGDCHFIEFDNRGFNSADNSYRFISTVVDVISEDETSFVTVSTMESRLFVDANIRKICARECAPADASSKEYCGNKCAEKIRYEHMSRIGVMKTEFIGHTQAATIANLRAKYAKFIKKRRFEE